MDETTLDMEQTGGAPEMDAFTAALSGEDEAAAETGAPEATPTDEPVEGAPEGTAAPEADTAAEGGEGEPAPTAQLPLQFGTGAYQLDAAAVQTIAGALGGTQQDVVTLLQRGLDYDHKAAREIGILTDFAQASGLPLDQYMEQLERTRDEALVQAEMQRIAAELPEGTPDEALQRIAERNLADQRTERQAAAQQEAQRAADDAERGTVDAWKALITEHPELREVGNVSPEMIQLIGQGHTPGEAFYRVQAQQQAVQLAEAQRALETEQRKQKNRETAVGSQHTAGNDGSDAFLAGLFS